MAFGMRRSGVSQFIFDKTKGVKNERDSGTRNKACLKDENCLGFALLAYCLPTNRSVLCRRPVHPFMLEFKSKHRQVDFIIVDNFHLSSNSLRPIN